MNVFEQIGSGFIQIMDISVLAFACIGVFVGILFGAAPGLTATTAIALFTPMTFKMPINDSFAFLLGIYCGGYYAGSIPAILIKTPGAPGNAATVIEGYPMAEKGQAGKALSLSVGSSFIGGILSALTLFLFAPFITEFALKFGSPEYFAVCMMGLACIASVSGKDIIKGVTGAIIGILISSIGMDSISGISRFTFGSVRMMGGVALIPALIGFFALTEVFNKTESIGRDTIKKITEITNFIPRFMDYWPYKWTILKSSLIGIIIGAIPGTGPTIASWMSYNEAKRTSKNPELFGQGSPEGLIACEASNNAVTGGALIPLMTLGLPGDSVTAILLGALMIQGLSPGPMLLVEHFDLLSFFLWILIVSNTVMLVLGLIGSRYAPYILKVPMQILVPFIMVFCVAGTYAVNNSYFDVQAAIILGILGFILSKFGFSMPPLVLGFLLGPLIELNFQRAMISSQMNPLVFVQSPLSIVIWAMTIFFTVFMYRRQKSS